jgi:GAF domain-containing protein
MATLPLGGSGAATVRRTSRGRLFRKYLLLILSLVTIALLASGAISLYFTYQETKASLASLQHEKALAAASRIEQYIGRIEQQLAYAALPQLDASDVELRRIEFLKLLRQAPEVTDIAQLDAAGREQIAVSRLGMDNVGSGRDRSQEPAFRNARRGQPWYGPVYFRKETEPYMTIALRSGGDNGPVIVADVNLKFIWDVVSRIKIGDKGKAYVVDGSGFLVADPDIGLVLRKTNLSQLPHIKAALSAGQADDPTLVSTDLSGTPVLASVAPIESLHWDVFVEQPVAEVYAKLNASIVRTGLLLLAGLVLSALGALALARGMVRPIRTLEEGAERIGAGDLDQKIEVHTGDELEALANRFNRMSAQLKESYAGLERKVEERTSELQKSLEQQTAISEILRVISSSPTDVQPVLEAVAEHAARLCEAPIAQVTLVDGEFIRPAAVYAANPDPDSPFDDPAEMRKMVIPLQRGYVVGRAMIDRVTLHYPDIVPLIAGEFPGARPFQERFGLRALMAVPLMREGGAYGAILIWRREPRAFSPDQVALLETFARQAAIAIDNVRLFNETKEALEQQRASGEVLGAISGSIADTKPVFDAILHSCQHLFDGHVVGLMLVREDGLLDLGAYEGEGHEWLRTRFPAPLNRDSGSGLAILEKRVVSFANIDSAEVPELAREGGRQMGMRSSMFAPLLSEGRAIGALWVGRSHPGAFTDKQIALLKTFADQAVIAIQNCHLFNETKEALEQQTAIAEILRVISSSPTDVRPVLDAIAERAARLCDATSASMYLTDGDNLKHLASKGSAAEPVTHVDTFPINRQSISGRAILDRKTMQIPDLLSETAEYPLSAEFARQYGHRTVAVVPLFREGQPFGTIVLRRLEVRAFTEREIDLLRTFGDQAAIALENIRLFNETKEALDQQRASGEVLTAISSSIADTKPVFDVILQSCQRLFAGDTVGITLLRDDGMLDVGANAGPHFDELKKIFPQPLSKESASGKAILERRVLAYPDVDAADMPTKSRDGCHAIGTQSIVFAPMLFEGRGIGTLWVGRPFKGPFSDKQLTLLKTFADQAVIAIQNARLFNETKEALDQQRASGEVLSAISSSIADTAPVFETILDRCERLFAGKLVQINLVGEDGFVHLAAYNGPHREKIEPIFPFPVDDNSATGLSIRTRTVVHFPDVDGASGVPETARTGWQRIGIKAAIGAPMLWEGRGIGSILVGRDYAGPFTEKEIALLKTFADQAVIAIQNARLFNETKEALDQQRASGEVLAAISSSIADIKPVFDKIVASCERLFSGKVIAINMLGDDGRIHRVAYHGPDENKLTQIVSGMGERESGTWAAIASRAVLHFPDIANDDDVPPGIRLGSAAVGVKSGIVAPMIWESAGIGAIMVGRDYVGPFSEKEIALLKTFADQAVIAIQNCRLFREIQEKSQQLEVANKHKSEFLANMSHELRTPLNAIIGFSEVLIERLFGDLNEKQADYLNDIHSSGKHLLTLINDILDLSKIEAGRMELEPSSFDVSSAVANALTLVRERAQRHAISLGQQVDPTLGQIVADERKFKQILLNLLSNAVKFTPDGGRIDVLARREDSNALISVHDTGIGIAPEDRAAVFEEFRQVGHDYTRKQEGTGLGLALTKKFVELHGGRIWLESEPGKGSTFTFSIPIRP